MTTVRSSSGGSEVAAAQRLEVPGLGVAKEPKRFYPQRELGAQVLGVVGTDGHGLEGLEITTCLRRGEVEVVTRFSPAAAAAYERFVETVRALRERGDRHLLLPIDEQAHPDDEPHDVLGRKFPAAHRRRAVRRGWSCRPPPPPSAPR